MCRSQGCRLLLAIVLALFGASSVSPTGAQEGGTIPGTPSAEAGGEVPPGRQLLLQAALQAPPAPAIVRLSRLSIEPGESFAADASPGPAFVLIETGSLAVDVSQPAILLVVDAPSGTTVSETFLAGAGDRLALAPATTHALRNEGTEPAVALYAAILPADDAAEERAATPNPVNAQAGAEAQLLGEGIAPTLPEGRSAVTLERFVLTAGLGVPAYPGPVLVAVEAGGFASTLDAGDVQISTADGSAASPTLERGAAFAVRAGDAIFFPDGMEATPPLTGENTLVLLRLGILPIATDDAATGPEFPVGATVVVTVSDVRLRAEPSTDGAILAGLAADQTLVVTGPPVAQGELVWYPVQDPNNPALVGYVAGEFLAPLE